MTENNSSKWGLIKKALYIWVVQYHFVIPKEILKGYIRKYNTESDNIAKYGKRFYDPRNEEDYTKWLTFQEYESLGTLPLTMIGQGSVQGSKVPFVQMDCLDLSKVDTEYVCICGKSCTFYEPFDAYMSFCKNYDLTYFDHDLIDAQGQRTKPSCKPDWSYDTLRGWNYIGDCWVIKKELLQQFDGQAWNPYAWLLELSDQKISVGHIEKILYGNTEPMKCNEETLRAYFEKHAIKANTKVNEDGVSVLVQYTLETQPLVSLIIPTRDGKDVLEVCLNSIFEKTTYQNYEIVIADNGSTKEETKLYFQQIQQDHANVRIVDCSGPFNFSKINNQAIAQSKGEYVVLLNNDTSILTRDWLEQMVSYAQLKHVGSVGVLMYYPDGSIQHGGVISGKGGGFAHRYYRKPHDEKGYEYTLTIPNDVVCCTAACLMIPRSKFDEVGGMNEELTVQFNDVDLGLGLLKKGYYNLFLPNVQLVHYESKSRGIDKEQSAVDRYLSEVEYAKTHYAKYIEHDPFYNDQFDKNYDYMLIVGKGSNE